MAIVEVEAEAAGDLLELLVLDRQRAQLAKANDELLFESIDDGHATPRAVACRGWRFCTDLASKSIDPHAEARVPPASNQ